jgi:hypothetical protein
MTTTTMSLSDVQRAYGEQSAVAGQYISVLTWTDAYGERTDMLTGVGASEAEARAETARMIADEQVEPGDEAVYLVAADD